ncbi:hypothetical protein FHT40_006152 [Mycolicibacterium sp. BK556]|nr:hypothetical protein [Mycolicibacterium sp. BK556]MBB3636293.1 hypothetical protein [Mycolicibacterium sp. BK607]TDO06435.1 hypothetical protein EV580_6522 [Mycobacterium sp. BK086]
MVFDTVDTDATGGKGSPPVATDAADVVAVVAGLRGVLDTWGVIGPPPHPTRTARPRPITVAAATLAEVCTKSKQQ